MPTNRKTIQAYNQYSQQWADKLSQGENLAHKYLEKPAMYGKLPNLKGKSVLCVGCGTGEECRYIKLRGGVKRVVGIDIAKNQIEYAKHKYPEIEFYQMDMEDLKFPKHTFDFVYSSLAVYFVKDWLTPLKQINQVLKPKGRLLFSVLHPIKTSFEITETKQQKSFLLGYVKHKKANQPDNSLYQTIHGDYLNQRQVEDTWFNEFRVNFYHKPFGSMLRDIRRAGFEIMDCLEPKAIKSCQKVHAGYWQVRNKIPLVMIFELKKSK